MSHQEISYLKSVVRIIAYGLMVCGEIAAGAAGLIVAELIGIWEEVGE